MGNNESSTFDIQEKLNMYQKREVVDDPRYGKVAIYNHLHNPNDLILVKKKWTNTISEAERLNSFVESRRANTHRNLAK